MSGIAWDIIQRSNNRSACFYADEDYRKYLDILRAQSKDHGCAVHAYVLMTNHVHLLVTPDRTDSASLMMKHLGRAMCNTSSARIGGRERCGRDDLDRVNATNDNFVLGNDRFKDQVATMLDRRVVPGKPGRPKRRAAAR